MQIKKKGRFILNILQDWKRRLKKGHMLTIICVLFTIVFIFANPTTMQILLSHFGDVTLKNVGKKSNAAVIKKMTGVQNYDASKQQIEDIVKQIHFKDLSTFKERLRTMSDIIDETPSTNFLLFLERFENEDDSWIEEINSLFKKR